MNEFDSMFEETKKKWPQITSEQFGRACQTVLAAAKPNEKLSMKEVSEKVQMELESMLKKQNGAN